MRFVGKGEGRVCVIFFARASPPPFSPNSAAKTIPDTLASLLANKTADKFGNSSKITQFINYKLDLPGPAAPTCTATNDPSYTDQFDAASQVIIECTGTPLKSISNWAMGECGTRTSADPRIFGPPAWLTFHTFAQNYPAFPTADVKLSCAAFINAIPLMLPCPHCGYDFKSFLQTNILYENTFNPACQASVQYNMPCQGAVKACESQSNLVNFFLRAHANVRANTQPCSKLWSPAMAAAAYTNKYAFCANNIVYVFL